MFDVRMNEQRLAGGNPQRAALCVHVCVLHECAFVCVCVCVCVCLCE